MPPFNAASPQSQPVSEPSFFHRHQLMFFIIGILLAAGLAIFVVYLLLPPAAPNIAISFSEPSSVIIGQPFPLSITVSNQSKSVLKNAELNIILPAGISFVGEDPGQQATTEQIDTLSSQTINPPENLELIATGAAGAASIAGTSQTISAKLIYETAETDNTQYETDGNTNVVIGAQPAVTVTYNAPSNIFSGQNFDLSVNYQNNTTGTFQDLQLQMQYPPAYNFVKSSLNPLNGAGNSWNLGLLAANTTGTFTITGNIVGPSGVQYQLNGTPSVSVPSSSQMYPLNPPSPANFSVTGLPLSLLLTLNNSSTYVAGLNDNLNYTLTYTNNSNIVFQGLNASVSFVGQMYDFTSVKSAGSFDSNADTISWNAANTPQLASLAPGQSGSVNFSINTKSAFPITSVDDKNYVLKAAAQITSQTVPQNVEGSSTQSLASLTNKVGGVITIGATGYYNDPTIKITNSGPYPPKANQATEYTIHWDIKNYSTDASSVTVSAYLQSGTTFTGQVESNVPSSTPVYNPTTGLITWTIPFVPATTGVIGSPAEAVFQVINTPSITEIGQDVTLLGPTSLSSMDLFTGEKLTASADPITSQLRNDTSIGNSNREVTQ
jgi:hypothetical protein